ncbi:MAG TPA: HEAT repeat domain-containing protein [Kofleriaceae bacterium]|jgi:HEAT repeat protein
MKNISKKLAAVAFVVLASSTAFAGKGGSADNIRNAITSHSSDAIIAEVERAESLGCPECIQLVTNLTEDNRYEVREVAAWWFAKRPVLRDQLAVGFLADLKTGDGIAVRNAADFLGASITYTALPALREAIKRDVGEEGKLAMVRAVKTMAHQSGNPVLTTAMTDRSPKVRAAAIQAWREILDQTDGTPAIAMLADSDAGVRANAATVAGAMKVAGAVAALENLVVNDGDAQVRSNAAWALGKLHSASSRAALTTASGDKSSLVRGVAKASLASLY